ncbi:putative HTH-type transcriptional regulator [compost metagenome]
METLTDQAMRELDDEGLGWFSHRLPWGTNGMLCRASLPSENLRVALSRWCRHFKLLVQDIELELTVQNDIAQLRIIENVDLLDQREFCLISTLRNIHGYACWLVDSRIPLERATFGYPAPRHFPSYHFMFRGELAFDADHTGFSFDAEYLKLPVRRDDKDLRQMLLRPLPLIVLQYRRDRLLTRRIRDLLRISKPEEQNADAIAEVLNLSTRSLYRHLAEEGSSLQDLKDEVRLDIALNQLTRTRKSLKQIAVAAGFRSEATFNRAFREWTGRSPGDYRRSVTAPE